METERETRKQRLIVIDGGKQRERETGRMRYWERPEREDGSIQMARREGR